MSKISGPQSPANASSVPSTERNDRTGTQSDRDVQTEGRRFSHLLCKLEPTVEGNDAKQLAPASVQHARDNAKPPREKPGSTDTPAKEQPIASYPDRQPVPQIEDRSSRPLPKNKSHDTKSDDHDATGQVSMTAAQWATLQGDSGQSEPTDLSRQSTGDMPKKISDPKDLSAARRPTIASELKVDHWIPQNIDRSLSTSSNKPDDQKDINQKDNRPGAIPGNTTRAMGDQILQGLLGRGASSHPQHLSPSNKVGGPLAGAPDQRDTPQGNDHQDATVDAAIRAEGDQILQGMLNQRIANDQTVSKSPDTLDNHIADLANRVAERILVSDRAVSTDSAVHIQLRDTVLAGSEISIHRDQGQLVVLFNVPDSAIGQQIRTHVGDLQRQLSDKIQQPVNIQVNVGSNATDSGGDGRSRNQRDLNVEWQSGE